MADVDGIPVVVENVAEGSDPLNIVLMVDQSASMTALRDMTISPAASNSRLAGASERPLHTRSPGKGIRYESFCGRMCPELAFRILGSTSRAKRTSLDEPADRRSLLDGYRHVHGGSRYA